MDLHDFFQGVFGENSLPLDGPGAGHTSMLGGSHIFKTSNLSVLLFLGVFFLFLFFMNLSALFLISSSSKKVEYNKPNKLL